MKKPIYVIVWDNGHASGRLAEEFTSPRKAAQHARAWKREMVAVEPTAADRKAAREAYSYEVVEKEEQSYPKGWSLELRDAEDHIVRFMDLEGMDFSYRDTGRQIVADWLMEEQVKAAKRSRA